MAENAGMSMQIPLNWVRFVSSTWVSAIYDLEWRTVKFLLPLIDLSRQCILYTDAVVSDYCTLGTWNNG